MNIVYETKKHFIILTKDGKWYETFKNGATAATRCASWSASLPGVLERAKTDIARREGTL